MTDDAVDLDEPRRTAGMIATKSRRHSLQEFEAAQEALRLRQPAPVALGPVVRASSDHLRFWVKTYGAHANGFARMGLPLVIH